MRGCVCLRACTSARPLVWSGNGKIACVFVFVHMWWTGLCYAVIKELWSRALSAVITVKVRSFNILWHWQQPSDRHLISCSFGCARLQIPVQFVTELSDSWVQRPRVQILQAKCMSSSPWDWSGNTMQQVLPLLAQCDWTASQENTQTIVKLSSIFFSFFFYIKSDYALARQASCIWKQNVFSIWQFRWH